MYAHAFPSSAMRTLVLLTALALLAFAPSASADGGAECDIDDDLYQHCNVGPVHVVYGPMCAGADVGERAECREILPLD